MDSSSPNHFILPLQTIPYFLSKPFHAFSPNHFILPLQTIPYFPSSFLLCDCLLFCCAILETPPSPRARPVNNYRSHFQNYSDYKSNTPQLHRRLAVVLDLESVLFEISLGDFLYFSLSLMSKLNIYVHIQMSGMSNIRLNWSVYFYLLI